MDEYLGVIEPHCKRITNDIKVSLERVKQELRARHLPFDDTVLKYFLDKIKLRIDATYNEFVNDLLFEEKLSSSHSTKRDIVNTVQNARANTDDCDKRLAVSSLASSHQSDIIEATNRNTVDEPKPESAVTPAETYDKLVNLLCEQQFFGSHSTGNEIGKLEIGQCSVVHGVNETKISKSHVVVLTPQEKIIGKNVIEVPSQCDNDVMNAAEVERPMTSNAETEDDVVIVDVANHEQTLADLEAIISSNSQQTDSVAILDAEVCLSSESFRCLESFVAKCINSTDITFSIGESPDVQIDAIEESSNVGASANGPSTNNQEVAMHEMDKPMVANVENFTVQSSINKRKCVEKIDGLPQKSIEERKRKRSNKSTTGHMNKKRKLTTDSNKMKRFKCELCDYATSRKGDLKQHMVKHSDAKLFKCEMCAKGFNRRNSLQNHMRTHARQFPFQCSICGQGFSLEQKLKLHEKNCNNKRFECYLCKYTSVVKSNLVLHMRKHTGLKPFHCSHCWKEYTAKSNLIKHIKRHHTKDE